MPSRLLGLNHAILILATLANAACSSQGSTEQKEAATSSEPEEQGECYILKIIACHEIDARYFECKIEREMKEESYLERGLSGGVNSVGGSKSYLFLQLPQRPHPMTGNAWGASGYYLGLHSSDRSNEPERWVREVSWGLLPGGHVSAGWLPGQARLWPLVQGQAITTRVSYSHEFDAQYGNASSCSQAEAQSKPHTWTVGTRGKPAL